MTVVVDANVALKWFVAQDDSDAADEVQSANLLLAPSMIVSEVTATLWRYVDRSQLTADAAREAVSVLPKFFSELVNDQALARRALDVALEVGYPPYDFFYLALAIDRDATVVTADKRLVNRLAATRYSGRVTLLSDWSP